MKYIVLVSHGELAQGMHSVLDMFAGQREDVLSTGLKNGMSTEEFKDNFRQLIKPVTPEDTILLFADILGGSPLTVAMELLCEQEMFDEAMVFTGMNVCACLTAVLTKDAIVDKNKLAENILFEGQSGLQQYVIDSCEDIEEL